MQNHVSIVAKRPTSHAFATKNTKNTKDDDDYEFVVRKEIHSNSMCKSIMNLKASKDMILHRVVFDTYEMIVPCNEQLGNDNVVKTIGLGSFIRHHKMEWRSMPIVPL
jgi:hypothetical protein